MYELPVVNRQPAVQRPVGQYGFSEGGGQRDPGHLSRGFWNSGLCECCADEEICWWTCWCNNMVAARTTAQFQIMRSMLYSSVSTAYASLLVFTFFYGYGGAFVFLFLVGCYVWPCIRAFNRSSIRGKLGINGTVFTDWLYHCCSCTSPCATCQEAREARAAGLPMIDLCSGEKVPDMSALTPNTDLVDGSGNNTSTHNNNTPESAAPEMVRTPEGAWMSMSYISITSKFILMAEVGIFLFSVVVLIAIGRGRSVFVLTAVFLQPVIILYHVYWRKQRNTVQLDTIIKLFAVGFFITTLQSAIFEEVVQTLGLLIFAPLVPSALAPTVDDDDHAIAQNDLSTSIIDDSPNEFAVFDASPGGSFNARNLLQAISGRTSLGSRILNIFHKSGEVLTDGVLTQSEMREGFYMLRHGGKRGSTTTMLGQDLRHPFTLDIANTDGAEDTLRGVLATHWPFILLACFFMAFVVAATVEETMKQFIVRCHRFSTPLADPYTIITYLLTGALGFTACENLSYVFSTTESPIPGTSIFTGEIMVLLLRVLLPVHLICSVLQGANLSRVLMGQARDMNLFTMLLSAIILHGSFDCSLFIMAAIAFVNDISGIWFEILTYLVACLIAGVGSWYAYQQYTRVIDDWEEGFHQLVDTTAHTTTFSDEREVQFHI